MERKSKGSMFQMKSSPAKLFGNFSKTKIKDVDKSKRKEKTKITGDKSFSFSLFNFGKR